MEFIHPEFIESLKTHQHLFADKISAAMTAEPDQPLRVEVTEVGAVKTADIYSELGVPLIAIQFGFTDIAEHPQVFLMQDETTLALASYLKGEAIEAVEENLISEIRATLEAVVQGTCLAAGQIRSETTIATNLSIRHQVFSLPPNLQRLEELIRVQMSVAGEEPLGSITWLLDAETVATIVVPDGEEEGESTPFAQLELVTSGTRSEDSNGLDILMDIPLEISVELGRVKMLVKDVVELGTGSIVEIDKAAGEPVDVMVNGRVVAKGEVVVIEDNFGVRITEILTPQERLSRLGEVA